MFNYLNNGLMCYMTSFLTDFLSVEKLKSNLGKCPVDCEENFDLWRV
ncbi:MAG: hypothetical protein ACYC63_14760 [Armatimonadota bacterium]